MGAGLFRRYDARAQGIRRLIATDTYRSHPLARMCSWVKKLLIADF